MKRRAWNYDLSTKPNKDILTNRHIYIYIDMGRHGSRSKIHARLLDTFSIRVTFADMDVYFCCSGKRPRKGGERFAKGLNTPIRL